MNFISSLISVFSWVLFVFIALAISINAIENENPTIFILLLISFTVFLIIRRGKKIREKEEAIKKDRIFSEIDKHLKGNSVETSRVSVENKNEKGQSDEIGTYAGLILVLLENQFLLLTHVENIKHNHFTIGYIFGLVDGLMQINDIDINDDIAWSVAQVVLENQYSNRDAQKILNIYEEQSEIPNSLLMEGIAVGGKEFFSKQSNEMSHVGLLNYFDNEEDKLHDEPIGDESAISSFEEQEGDLEARLEKLTKLYKNKLITKKVYEEKQAKILSEL